jgi:hypothetical protein
VVKAKKVNGVAFRSHPPPSEPQRQESAAHAPYLVLQQKGTGALPDAVERSKRRGERVDFMPGFDPLQKLVNFTLKRRTFSHVR